MGLRRTRILRAEKAKSGTAIIHAVTIPKEFIELLGWKPGDELELVLDLEKREIRIRRQAA